MTNQARPRSADLKGRPSAFIGGWVYVKFRITKLRKSTSKPDRGIIWEGGQMINQRGEVVQEGEHPLMIWRRPK